MLRVEDSIDKLFELLRLSRSESSRGEIGLAIARIIGDEKYYLQHWRSFHSDFNTSVAQALLAFQKPADRLDLGELAELSEASANSFAIGDLDSGVIKLTTLLRWLPTTDLDATLITAVPHCICGLQQYGPARKEFVLLSLHTGDAVFQHLSPS
jgi:hypothetical protein